MLVASDHVMIQRERLGLELTFENSLNKVRDELRFQQRYSAYTEDASYLVFPIFIGKINLLIQYFENSLGRENLLTLQLLK